MMRKLVMLCLVVAVGSVASAAIHANGNVTYDNPGTLRNDDPPGMFSDGNAGVLDGGGGWVSGNWFTGDGADGEYARSLTDETAPVLTLDLGAEYALTDVLVNAYGWNSANNNTADIKLSFAGADEVFGDYTDLIDVAVLNNFEVQEFSLGGTIMARYVKVKLMNSHEEVYGANWIGLNEVAFVPEPATLALLGLGSLLLRRRK